jgi:hypothetical protein
VTEAAISLLRSLAQAEVVTFMPEDNTAVALDQVQGDGSIASKRRRGQAGWSSRSRS